MLGVFEISNFTFIIFRLIPALNFIVDVELDIRQQQALVELYKNFHFGHISSQGKVSNSSRLGLNDTPSVDDEVIEIEEIEDSE